MIQLLGLYGWTLLAAVTMAPALALIGTQLTARDQAMQALVQSQASALGVVGGLALILIMGGDIHDGLALLPLIGALLFGAIAFLGLERVIPKSLPARNSYYVSAFAVFLALTFLITSLTPRLESHMASLYFGDLALASNDESIFAAMIGALATIFMAARWRAISDQSFQLFLFGSVREDRTKPLLRSTFLFVTIATIGFSIQILGLLFTLSALFLPTALLTRPRVGLIRHGLEVALVAAAAADAGLLISLKVSQLPTAPSVVLCLLIIGFITRLIGQTADKPFGRL